MRHKTRSLGKLMPLLSLVLVSYCAKVRPPEWPVNTPDDIYSKDEISNADVNITLDTNLAPAATVSYAVQAIGEMKPVMITKADTTNERVKAMFAALAVDGRPGATYKVRMTIDRKYVTASRVVPADEIDSLSVVDRLIVTKVNDETLLPLFQFKIDKQGIVERQKNDLHEDTRTLQLTETDATKATHLQISALVNNRLNVQVPATAMEDFKRLFVISKIDGRVFTDAELKSQFNFTIVNPGLYVADMVSNHLNLLKVAQTSDLSPELKEALAKNPANDLTGPVSACSAEVLAQIPADLKDGCVLVLSESSQALQFKDVRRTIDDRDANGAPIMLNTIEAIPSDKPESAQLVFFDKAPELTEQNTAVSVVSLLNAKRILIVDDMRNKEYFMRRTMQDSPNTFAETFAGSSGDLDLVNFTFEDKQVRVRKVDALVDRNGNSNTDKETVMLLPAQYYKIVHTDAQGNATTNPRLVDANFSDKGIIAYVDWSANSIPTINSPLDFLGLEQCFNAPSERVVSDIDHRLAADGVLNLTLTSTYAANPASIDCAGLASGDGYFDRVQRTFTFKERVSFKLHVADTNEDKPLLDVPFAAQKVMGFGLFTYNRKKADPFGNTGVDGTEIPLPSVFDITNGKTINYVLAGLPTATDAKSKELREAVIKATQETVDDLNSGFRKALDGTPAAHKGDVIKLIIPANAAEEGQLGDLDKNHIFFIDKSTDSGVIGLGGAHANPRNGKVESASIYLYAGNMLAEIEYLRKLRKAHKDYVANMTVTDADKAKLKKDPTKAAPATGGDVSAVGAASSRQMSAALQALKIGRNLPVAKVSSKKSTVTDVTRWGQTLAKLKPGLVNSPTQVVDAMSKQLSQADQAIAKTIEIGKSIGALSNPRMMDQIYNRMLTDRQPISAHHAHKAEEFMTPIDRMEAAHVCVMTMSEAETAMATDLSDKLDKMSDLELLIAIWKPTMAHEIGHNLGLRHNFEGSFDKANWTFGADEKTPRNYSAIMDYLVDDHLTYDGLGPQDVMALRAAYSGMVELSDAAKKLVKTSGGKKFITSGAGVKVDVVGDGLVKMDDIPKAVGLTSWLDFQESSLQALPLKPYKFCSDEEAGDIPVCNRFDSGTTPAEIVDYNIRQYRERYSLTNFGNDKLSFTTYGDGAYIGRIFGLFTPIRQYLDETFYQAIYKKADGDTVNSYVQATVNGLLFFNGVIRTPDAPAELDPADRFEAIEADMPNPENPGESISKTVKIERKFIQNLQQTGEKDRIAVRGIEYDKVISLILLTERDLGFPRYNQVSLNLSYPDVEKLLVDHTSALQLPTVQLLTEVLGENIQAQGATLDAGAVQAPLSMQSSVTELMTMYGLFGSIINLDSTGIEAADNMSRAFRVLSNFNAPKDQVSITLPGSSGDLNYYTFSGAEASKVLVDTGAALAQVRLMDPDMKPLITQWIQKTVALKAETDAAKLKDGQAEIDALTKQINDGLGMMNEAIVVKDMAVLGNLALQVVDEAAQIDELLKTYTPEQLTLVTGNMNTTLANLGKQAPSVNLVLSALGDAEAFKSPAMQLIVPATNGQVYEALLFRNVQLLSDLFLGAHPEYLR